MSNSVRFGDFQISVISATEYELSRHQDPVYHVATSIEEAKLIRNWVYDLTDGEMIRCRGRDKIFPLSDHFDTITHEPTVSNGSYTPFEDGLAIKFERQLYFLWQEKVECYDIGIIDFVNLLHFACTPVNTTADIVLPLPATHTNTTNIQVSHRKVVVLCHGYSPELGPNYPFISVLKQHIIRSGFLTAA